MSKNLTVPEVKFSGSGPNWKESLAYAWVSAG
jgi:hypothetical protein